MLPVLAFMLYLLYMDSYKLVKVRSVSAVLFGGVLVTVASYFASGELIYLLDVEFSTYSKFMAPLVEESLKALIIVFLFRAHRIGFLVDGAIMGFAVGAGFALAENIYYLSIAGNANVAVWIVRGFGTAVMHGGATAIFAVITQTATDRNMKINPLLFLPGLAAATLLHGFYNQFVLPPMLMTLLIILSLPPVFYLVFQRSASHLHDWLELDFDEDAELMQQINSGNFAEGKIGRFLTDLRSKFDGPVVADMLCYLRINTELALRAKGLLLMRENGLEVPVEESTREKFAELEYLEGSIGKTGILAMRPFLHMTRKDLWQLYMLDSQS